MLRLLLHLLRLVAHLAKGHQHNSEDYVYVSLASDKLCRKLLTSHADEPARLGGQGHRKNEHRIFQQSFTGTVRESRVAERALQT